MPCETRAFAAIEDPTAEYGLLLPTNPCLFSLGKTAETDELAKEEKGKERAPLRFAKPIRSHFFGGPKAFLWKVTHALNNSEKPVQCVMGAGADS